MKTIMLVALMLIGMIGWGQEAKLNSWLWWGYVTNDTIRYAEYTYDSAGYLTQVYYRSNMYTTYSNDTLIKTFNGAGGNNFFYDDDSVMMVIYFLDYPPDTVYLKLSEDNEIVEIGDWGEEYIWDDGNCMSEIRYGDTIWHREYYSEYINPWYEENKYLRWDQQIGTYSGSYNLFSSHINWSGPEWEMVVTESIGPYPTVIDYYSGGDLNSTFYLNYKYVITEIPEVPDNDYKIYSVDYFDLMGRRIPKPVKGFYIERQTTDKGIVSKKFYIQ